jgi:HSP20 family protein
MAKAETKEIQRSEAGKEIEATRPLSSFEEMNRLFDRWLESISPRGWMRPFRAEWPSWTESAVSFEVRAPKVDVIDRDHEVIVRAEVPGVAKEDLEVSVTDSAITIKGEMKREEKEEKGDYYRHEISRGAFARMVTLPNYVETEGAKAKFKDGILELSLPKVEKAKRRTVKID